ncbi:MAG: c-type cytochrome [Bacteroidota bacterium]|nr:cytochrome c family protein [Kiloniellaceae bacterium]
MASSLESNKIAAAVLTAGVIAMMSGFVANLLYHPQVELAENAYPIAAAPAGGAGEAPAQEEVPLEPIGPLLASADAAAGEQLAGRQCASCHTFNEGGAARVGPNLYDIVQQPIAAEEGFSYSSGLSGHAGESWSYENLNAFLHSPRDFAPGTKMSFRGFSKPEDIANVVAYLRSLSGSPAPLPE